MKSILIRLLKLWARLNIAPGYLYQVIEKWAHTLYRKPMEARLFNGLKVNCDLRESIQRILYFFGYYEAAETYVAINLLQPGDRVIDAGANIGYYSLVASQCVGQQGQVYSFEPIPKNYDRLKNHIEINHKESVIHPNNMGLWDKQEQLTFSQPKDTTDNMGTYSAGLGDEGTEAITCNTIALDDYVEKEKIPKVNFIKMDVEGAELKALQGAKKTISHHKPLILLEVCDYSCARFGYQPNDLWEFLQPFGYKMFLIRNSSKKSGPIADLKEIKQRNVLFYTDELPEALTGDWSVSRLRKSFFN